MRSFMEERRLCSNRGIAGIIALLALLVMIAAASSVSFAADTVYTEGALKYTIKNDSITIVGYFGKDKTVTVPNQIAGIPVNTIAKGAFDGTAATEVKLPDTITSIQEGAIGSNTTVVFNSNTSEPEVVKPTDPPADSGGGEVQKDLPEGTKIDGEKHDYVVTKGASGSTLEGARLKDSDGRTYTVNANDEIVDDETGSVVEKLPKGSYSSISSVDSEEVDVDLDDTIFGVSSKKVVGGAIIVVLIAGAIVGYMIYRRRSENY